MNNKSSVSPNNKSIMFASVAVGILILITLILSLVFSPSANKTVDEFLSCCESGDTVGMERFAYSAYTDTPEEIQKIIDEMYESVSDSDEAHTDSVSATDVLPSVQAVVMTNSDYKASTIWTLNKKATVKITVTSPDMSTIIDLIYQESQVEGTEAITEEWLYNKIVEYCNSQNYVTKATVKIPMERKGDTWYIDFEGLETLDVLTGGLITAYNDLYIQAYEDFIYSYSEMEEISNEG